jgi:hypothetical protein
MSTNHPHVNRANDATPDEEINPPSTFGNFPLDEAVLESTQPLDGNSCLKFLLT